MVSSSRSSVSSSSSRSASAYRSTLRRLVSLSRFGSKPGLERINALLAALGNPQKNFKCVLVAGTNGKGSTTAMLAKIMTSAGFTAGSYFSPSIFSFRERIQVNGHWISKKDFSARAQEVFSALPNLSCGHPTFFEVMTAMALLHFKRCGVDFAVLEVGLGGRYDATNAVEPELSIITSIGLEHAEVLGSTTAKIAREKAGIMRAGKPVVCAVNDKAALSEIKKISKRLNSQFYFADEKSASAAVAGFRSRAAAGLSALPLFQRSNIAAAVKSARLLGVKRSVITNSLSSFSMPARWQKMQSRPSIIIDCCHNPPAAKKIQNDLRRDFSISKSSPRVLLFSAMNNKDYPRVLALLAPHFDSIVLCRPPYKRTAKIGELKKAAMRVCKNVAVISDPDSALAKSKSISGARGRILVCGSIYLLQYLFGEREFRITG